MKPLKQLTVVVGLAVVAAGLTWLLKGPPLDPTVEKCNPAILKPDEICLADARGKILWIDARPRSEWQENGLEGSVLWNLDPEENQQEFEAQAAMKAIEAELVVVYCGTATCGTSRQIANRLRNLQLGPPVKVLYGGWDSLKDSSSAP